MRTSLRTSVAFLLLAAAACSDSPVEPKSDPIDLATAFDELSMPALSAAGAGVGVMLPVVSTTRNGCAYDGVSMFVCAPISKNGVTINSSYSLLTLSGATQPAFDVATTDGVRTMTSVVGTLVSGAETMHLDDQRTSTLSGLLSGHHVINGNGTSHLTTTGGLFPMDATITTTIVDLLPPLRGGNGFPRGGTVTTTIADAAVNGFPASNMTVVMVFDGSSKVAVTMTVGGRTTHCAIDLVSGTGAGSCFGV